MKKGCKWHVILLRASDEPHTHREILRYNSMNIRVTILFSFSLSLFIISMIQFVFVYFSVCDCYSNTAK